MIPDERFTILSSHHLQHHLSICSMCREKLIEEWPSWLFYCVVYLDSAGVQGPQVICSLPGLGEGTSSHWVCVIWEAVGKNHSNICTWLMQLTFMLQCSARFSELVRKTYFFFYLNIFSSGPANCLKWEVLAEKAKPHCLKDSDISKLIFWNCHIPSGNKKQ